jgi:gas vesicle protein
MVDGGGRTISSFLLGLGIGMGVALLLAPQSGEDTREWLADNAGRQMRRWRRKALRTWDDLRDNLSSDRVVSRVVRTSKSALGSLSSERH